MALTGGKPVVEFTPSRANIPPHSSVSVQAIFAPHCEQAYNYNVQCKVGGRTQAMCVCVSVCVCEQAYNYNVQCKVGGRTQAVCVCVCVCVSL